MKISFLFATLLAATSASASIDQAPPNFAYSDGEAVFVDFTRADYKITYDFSKKTVNVESSIEFEMIAKGYPIFDLIPEPTSLRLDDRDVTSKLTADPDGESKFRVLNQLSNPGMHRMTLTHVLSTGVGFRATGVGSAFWMSDLSDRQYLEQYLPTNFEYDQIPMRIRVEILNAAGMPHVLRANGDVKTLGENVFEVEFPKFYTTSSMFYHLLPAGAVPSTSFTIDSVDGRKLPVEVYTNGNMSAFIEETKKVVAELEADYGAFPHAKLIIYGAGSGGMEYSGATMTSLYALGHELFHSYNARAVMPAQGNSGWIDEAISSWRDRGYRHSRFAGGTTNMAGHSLWTRMTDDDAYSKGAAFLEWMAGKMEATGKDFKLFLRDYFAKNFYSTVTTESLQAQMESYSSLDLAADFSTYVYGRGSKEVGTTWGSGARVRKASCNSGVKPVRSVIENPYHPRLTAKELQALIWP